MMRTESDLNSAYAEGMDWKLELVMVPVTDVDRAKAFYTEKIGFNADHDHRVNESLRFVQLTPPGSACSIAIGEGITQGTPGSAQGLQIVQDLGWGLFIFFKDPDGNSWAIQQLPPRPSA